MLSRFGRRLAPFQACPNYAFVPGSASGSLWPSLTTAGEPQPPKMPKTSRRSTRAQLRRASAVAAGEQALRQTPPSAPRHSTC